jgi:hypothetical protein
MLGVKKSSALQFLPVEYFSPVAVGLPSCTVAVMGGKSGVSTKTNGATTTVAIRRLSCLLEFS